MNKVSGEEARKLLSQPLYCEDCPDWTAGRELKGLLSTSCGLLDSDGKSNKLIVELRYRRSAKTKTVQYVFSVFERSLGGLRRIYQLDITQWPRPVKDLHSMPHEHIGADRNDGDSTWSKWTFEQVLLHFCSQTNITFTPNIPHPEELRLKGQK